MLLWSLLPSLVSSQEYDSAPNLIDICNERLDKGTYGPASGFKYYFVKELGMCFPYRYNGAKGGRNSFSTEQDCHASCVAQDQMRCGANKEPTGSCLEWEHYACPSGSTCKRGSLGVGLCCDETNEAEWEKEYNPACFDGLKIATRTVWWGEIPVRGRKCADGFCPDGSQCFEGKWLAYCCLNKEDVPQLLNDDSPYQ